jgi:hypothetical protein
LIGCTRSARTEYDNPSTVIQKVDISFDVDTCTVELDGNYLFNYKKFSTDGAIYAGYNNHVHSIDFFDINEKRVLSQLILSKEGPESVQRVEGIYYHNMDSIFLLDENSLSIFNSIGKLKRRIKINFASDNTAFFSSNNFTAGNETNNLMFDKIHGCVYSQNLDFQTSQCSSKHFDRSVLGKINLKDSTVELLPIYYSKLYHENFYGFYDTPKFSMINETQIVYNFPIESSVYVYDLKEGHSMSFGGESKFTSSVVSSLPWKSCKDVDAKMQHFVENVRFEKVIYDPFRDLFYRFHYGDAKGRNADGTFMNPNQKSQLLTVFSKSYSVLLEMEINDRRYIIPNSFVGPEGLYLCAPKGENTLRFKVFRFKVDE